MTSVIERRKHARSKHPAGSVSRHAQQRVDERVRDAHGAPRRRGCPATRLARWAWSELRTRSWRMS